MKNGFLKHKIVILLGYIWKSKIPRGTDRLDYIKALPGTTLRTTQKKSTAGGMVAGAGLDLFS